MDPKWPSIDEQLRAATVVHGSALEQLIKDNQDLHMLRPEEAHDRIGLPPWLRVYWRKLHPNADYSGPSGGYPLALADLYEWMVDHQDLRTPTPDVVDTSDPRLPFPYTADNNKKGRRRGH